MFEKCIFKQISPHIILNDTNEVVLFLEKAANTVSK